MGDYVLIRMRVSGEEEDFTLIIHPASGMVQSDIPPIVRTAQPTISGTGVVGTNHNYTAGVNSADLPMVGEWALDGTGTGVPAVVGTPYIPAASANGKRLSVIEIVPGFPTLTAEAILLIYFY